MGVSRSRPYAAGRVPPPQASELALLALTHTHAELAEKYGTTPRVIASWLDDVRSGRGLVASVYAPTDDELIDACKRGLDLGIARLTRELEHATGKDAVAIVRELRETRVALASLGGPPVDAYAEPDLDRELDDFRRLTETGEYALPN